MDIERLAVCAVIDVIARTDYLSPFVNSGDKEPSWDGHIYAYSHISKSKKYSKGRAPVQVKGTLRKRFSKDKFCYRVEIADLRSYRREGGTVYFVVQISGDGIRKKIFYNALLPYEINQLLQNSNDDGKVSVTMYEFPIDKNEVTNVIFDFISDRERQDLLKNGKSISIDSIVQHIGLEKLNFGFSCAGIGYDLNKPYEYLFNHDIYLYAENKDINYQVPICHMWRAESAQTKMGVSVCANGKEYFRSCEILHTPDCDEIHFGKSIIIKEPHKGNPSLCFSLKGNINERISSIEFLLDMVDGKGIMVDGKNIKTEFYAQQIEESGLNGLEGQLQYLKDVKDVLESVDVQIPLECDNITDKDESYIKMLLLGIKYGEPINFNDKKVPPIGYIAIANLNIILHFIESEDGKYKIENFADSIADCKSDYADGEFFDTSKYTILREKDFSKISNLRFDKMEEEIFSIENRGHLVRVNLMMLEMICAYDVNKNDAIIQSAIRIGIWLIDKDNDADLAVLNVYQCYYRIRKLSDEELDILENITQRRENNPSVMLGAYILLENNRKAKRIFENMELEKQKDFMEFPIYRIWTGRENESIAQK